MTVPVDCPAGYYCPALDYFTDRKLAYHAIGCPIGTYTDPNLVATLRISLLSCLACPANKYCQKFALATAGEGDCASGHFCKSGAKTPKPLVVDPSGNYGPCPKGYYCDKAARETDGSPKPCAAGTWSPVLGAESSSVCQVCPEGKYCSTTGLPEPEGDCGVGYYCPKGSTMSNPSATKCVAGTYCPYGSTWAMTCPVGLYSFLEKQGKC